MSLVLDAATQNISTPSGDTGTYSWDDIFALGSTKITKTGNFYLSSAQIDLAFTSTLNIDRQNIEITDIAFINGKVNVTNSRIIISAQYSQPPQYRSLGGEGVVTDSSIVLRATDQYTGMAVSFDYFVNSHVFGENFSNAGSDVSRRLNLLTGTTLNTYIKNITEVVFTSTQSKAEGLRLLDVNDGIVNFNTGQVINLYGYSSQGTTRLHYKVGQGSFRFINSPDVLLSKGGVLNPNSPSFGWGGTTPTVFQAVAHYLKIIDLVGGVVGASVVYTGYSIINLTSTSGGSVSEIILDIENTNAQSNIENYVQNSSGTVPALTTVSTPDYTRIIKSYAHIESLESFVLTKTSSLGSLTSPVSLFLITDDGVTQSNTTIVGAYTGIAHTTSTITVTEARTLNEIYDSRKLYWRNNTGISSPFKEGDVFNLNGANLVIDGVTLVPSTKFTSIKTTGIVSYLNNGDASIVIEDSAGIRTSISILGLVVGSEVRLYDEATDLDFAGVESCASSTQTFAYIYTPGVVITLVVFKPDYIPVRLTGIALTNTAQNIQVQQRLDRVYTNP